MPKKSKKNSPKPVSPHNSRKFTATTLLKLPYVLTLALVIMFIASFVIDQNQSSTRTIFKSLSLFPFSLSNHFILAQRYFQANDINQTKKEIRLIENLQTNYPYLTTNNLGPFELTSFAQEVEELPIIQEKQLSFWENIYAKYPQYQDALVQLVYLNYNFGNFSESKKYLEELKSLFPQATNNLPIQLKKL